MARPAQTAGNWITAGKRKKLHARASKEMCTFDTCFLDTLSPAVSMNKQKYIEDACRASLPIDEILRSFRSALYAQTFKTFEKLNVAKSISPEEAAKQYEELLHTHIELIEQHYHIPVMRRERDNYTQILSIWTFCEILYFSKEQNILLPLMHWVNDFNKSYYFEYDKYSIYHYKAAPIFHEDFWKYASRMAVLGQYDQLVDLLKHTLERTSPNRLFARMEDLYKLLDEKKSIRLDFQSLQEVRAKTEKITAKNEATQFHVNSLLMLLDILLGDEDAIRRNTKDDIHAFLCSYYYKPVQKFNIYDAAKHYFDQYPTESPTIYELLLKQNLYQALELCTANDWWLLCHMSDIFDSLKEAFSQTMSVEFVREEPFRIAIKTHTMLYYASFLHNTFGLWEEAFTYMLQCGEMGKDVINEHLKIVDISMLNDEQMNGYIQFCEKHSIYAIRNDLCMRRANYLLSSMDYQGALTYFSKANAYQQIDAVFATIIQKYAKQGIFVDLQIHPQQFSGHHYSLYFLLMEMNQHYTQLKIQEAANAFKKLIRVKPIPAPMIPIILWEGLKVVEGYPDMIDIKDMKVIKLLWTQLSKSNDPAQFELFYYHIQKNKNQLADPTAQALEQCTRHFLDATSLRYSVAFAKLQN